MFKYDYSFLKILVDELYSISQESGKLTNEFSKKAIEQWLKKPEIPAFRKWVDEMYLDVIPTFVMADFKRYIKRDFYEIFIIELHQLLNVFDYFSTFYTKIDNKSGFLKETGIDLNIKEAYIAYTKAALPDFLKELYDLKIVVDIADFKEVQKTLINKITKALKFEDEEKYMDYIYMLDETISDFMEDINEDGFLVYPEQLEEANKFLKFLIIFQSFIYYSILLFETLEFEQLASIGIYDYDNKLYYSERMERLDWDRNFDDYMTGKK
ncbi:hypothetical protein [Mycoplasma capricolum]|uniref:hypothetical protein n=1 Tax=Mycoplasma capricolum TaxID=2095 RepID=UPI003DA605D6